MPLHQQSDYGYSTRGGKFPVRFESRIVDGHIVSVAFHPYFKSSSTQDGRDAGQCGMSVFQQFSFAAVEEAHLTHADHQSLGSHAHLHFVLPDFISQRVLELASQFVDVNAEARCSVVGRSSPRDLDHVERSIREFRAGYAGTSRYADIFDRRTRENPQLLKCSLDGGCYLRLLLLIGLRRSIEHYKKSKEQCDEVGVGNQPAFMIGMSLMFFLTTHALAASF